MGSRRKARVFALQLLYQRELNNISTEFMLEKLWEIEKASDDVRDFTETLFLGTIDHINHIDEIIKKCALNWDMNRIAYVDRNIIRMALFEMMYIEKIPPAVSINEAIDIAKEFSTLESGKFVNGILDKAKKILSGKKCGDKSENRNPKHETNTNDKNSKFKKNSN